MTTITRKAVKWMLKDSKQLHTKIITRLIIKAYKAGHRAGRKKKK